VAEPPRENPHGVRLTIAYDGTDFFGWQAQPQGRTVQTAIEAAITAMGIGRTRLRGCSRTDSGVHARGQIAAFSCDRELPRRGWIVGLNGLLPPDVAILDAEHCARRYDPRNDCIKKLYRYSVVVGQVRDPLTRRQAYHLSPRFARQDVEPRKRRDEVEQYVDLAAMRAVASAWEGRHDFRAFRATTDRRDNTMRTMHAVRVLQRDERSLCIEVEGDAFMKNMVRIMAGTLLEIGRRKMSVEDGIALLGEDAKRTEGGPTAPAHGLCLERIWLGRKSAD